MWRGKKAYYYRAVRTPAGPRHFYLGSGPAAEVAADADRARRDQQAAGAREHQQRAARHSQDEAPLDALGAAADVLVPEDLNPGRDAGASGAAPSGQVDQLSRSSTAAPHRRPERGEAGDIGWEAPESPSD